MTTRYMRAFFDVNLERVRHFFDLGYRPGYPRTQYVGDRLPAPAASRSARPPPHGDRERRTRAEPRGGRDELHRMPLALSAPGSASSSWSKRPGATSGRCWPTAPAPGRLDLARSTVRSAIRLLFLLSLLGRSQIERIAADRESSVAVRSTPPRGLLRLDPPSPPAGDLPSLTLDVTQGSMRATQTTRDAPTRPFNSPHPAKPQKSNSRQFRRPSPRSVAHAEDADLALRLGVFQSVGLPYYRVSGQRHPAVPHRVAAQGRTPTPRPLPQLLGGRTDYTGTW